MLTSARQVLEDCRAAHEMLDDETDERRYRILWVSAIALVRTVGHVLHKIAASDNPKLKRVVDEQFRRWKSEPAHSIFTDFIECERNNVLKTYEFGWQGGEVPGVIFSGQEHELVPDLGLGENLYRPLTDGQFAGEDGRDVLADAISWWTTRLDEIDAAMANAG